MPYAFREAFKSFRRTPLLMLLSIIAISLSLFVVGLFALTAFNIRLTIDELEERVEVVAYLYDSATDAQIRAAESEISALPEVRDVRFVSKTEALAIALEEMEDFRDVFSDLETNPLPASIEVRLESGHRGPESVENVAQHLFTYSFVEDVQFGRDWVQKIVSIRRIAGGATAIIGGAFAVVAAIIIATAVRIAVFARREEIAIMRLVGATNGFIQRPFLIEGVIAGLLGGLLAVGLTYGAYEIVKVTLLEIFWLPDGWALAGVVVGVAFGLIASAVSVRRHLGAIEG